MALKEYASKREFSRTPEPAPGAKAAGSKLRFVVHKHAARAMHYDLRLELDGVLKSWSVPKGPTLDPSVKRLAVMVEDHPLEYRDFEGVIPEKNYGAGSVIIWDRGFYRHPSATGRSDNEKLLEEGLRKGDLKFVLEGKKLHGEFALVRMKNDGRSWLLLKKKDKGAAAGDILEDNRSVASHKTLEEMLETGQPGTFRRKKVTQIRIHEAMELEDLKDAPIRPMPANVSPMLATTAEGPFDHADWIYEVKWDGYRAIAEVREGKVNLYSRNGISFNKRFGPVTEALRALHFDAVLDGEIVVVDEEGKPDFQMLQHHEPGKGRLLYSVFDLLHFQGHDLTGLPLLKRKEILKKVLPLSPRIRYSEQVKQEGTLFFTVAKQKGLEGIIAKHGSSTYEPGGRSRQWLKVKTRRTQEGVITGFTAPGGSRKHFGALVLGAYEGDTLVPIGSVGAGFSSKDLKEIHERLETLVRTESPFAVPPDTGSPVTWVSPELVCEVSLAGWTDEDLMRQPSFLRLREDKAAREVVRDRPEPAR
jgi:bifunctional non-homologous end joining protein LigD